NTFRGSDNEDANEHIEKVLEIVDLFVAPNVNQDQLMLRDFPISLTRAASRWSRNEPAGLDVPTRQILDSKGVIPTMNAANAKKAFQDMADHFKKWHNGTSSRSKSSDTRKEKHLKKHTTLNLEYHSPKEEDAGIPSKWRIRFHQYSVLSQQKEDMMTFIEFNRATILFHGCLREYSYDMEEIKARMNSHCSAILNDALPQKEKDPGSFTLPCFINNLCFSKALIDLGACTSVIPYSTFINLDLGKLAPTTLIVELADRTVKCPKGIAENVLVGIDKFVFPVDFIILDMHEDIKTLLILGRPFLSTAHAIIDVFKRKIALRVGNDKIVFKSNNPTSNQIA
ncbi:DNA/RNA polymerases superfamily protein, partial [Tanacetum coccineum]